WPLERKMRTFLPSCSVKPTRSALPVAGLKMATLDTWMGMVLSTMPPISLRMGLGLTCFLTTLTPSTRTYSALMRCSTTPRRLRSLPVRTMTSSPLRILFMAGSLEDFRGERHDLHELVGTQFARDRSEDTS